MADNTELTNAIQEMAVQMQGYLEKTHNHLISITEALDYVRAHLENRSNPHEVSANDLGLGYLQNYPVASRDQAIGGENNESYMTPLRTNEAMEPLVDAIIDAFEQGTMALQT